MDTRCLGISGVVLHASCMSTSLLSEPLSISGCRCTLSEGAQNLSRCHLMQARPQLSSSQLREWLLQQHCPFDVTQMLNFCLCMLQGSAQALCRAAWAPDSTAVLLSNKGAKELTALYFTQRPPGMEAQTFPVSLPCSGAHTDAYVLSFA